MGEPGGAVGGCGWGERGVLRQTFVSRCFINLKAFIDFIFFLELDFSLMFIFMFPVACTIKVLGL
jgi:hypothetical protein